MSGFGFDPSIILSAMPKSEGPSLNDTLQTLSQLATQRTQQQHAQVQLADLARQQQQQQQLGDIYRGNADTPGNLATALMRGGFGPQAYAAQDQSSQMQTQEATRMKLIREIQDAQRKKVGDLFYGTKDDADYQGRLKQLASDPDSSVAMYAHMLPPHHDPAVTEYLGNLAVPAVERAKLAARANGSPSIVTGEDGTQYVANKQNPGAAATVLRDENGNPIKKPRTAGAAGAGGGAGGGLPNGLTPEALEQQVDTYHQTGALPPLGQGKSGAAWRAALMNRHAEKYPSSDLAGAKAGYSADTKSLASQQKLADQVEAFETTAGKNLDTFLEQANKVSDTGSPLFNAPGRKFQDMVAGNPEMAAFKAARQTAVSEIGKVLSGSMGGGALSDSARTEVQELIGPDASLAQIKAAAEILKRDMANRKASVDAQLKATRGRISGKPAKDSAASGLSADEAEELKQLEKKFGGKP